MKAKWVTAILTVAMVFCLMFGIICTVSAATGDVWNVSDSNGWNQHLQLGGNPYGSDTQHVARDDGFTETFTRAASTQSYGREIDLRYPFRFDFAITMDENSKDRPTSFGFGSSYYDCFWTTGINEDGSVCQLQEHCADSTKTDLIVQFTTFVGSSQKSIFKTASEDGNFKGIKQLVQNPDFGMNDVVSLEIYIGTGAEGDESYIRILSVGDTVYDNVNSVILSVTRDDFIRENAIDVNGNTFNNDGTKAYFVHIAGSSDIKSEKRLMRGHGIDATVESGYTTTLPSYAFEKDEVSFTVTGENPRVIMTKASGKEETLVADAEGNYTFTMPVKGILGITVERADYTVRFMDGADLLYSQTVAIGGTLEEPAQIPEKTGYIFEGWYTDAELTEKYVFGSPINGNVEIYAGWTEGLVIKFVDSENELTVYDEITIPVGGQLTDPVGDPVKTGSSFAGWYLDKEGEQELDKSASFSQNTTVYAVWGYTVTYRLRGFRDYTSAAIRSGDVATAPTIHDIYNAIPGAAYVDLVWYKDAAYSQEYDFETGVTQSMTLYGRMYDNGGLDRTFDKTGWDVESGISMDAEGNRVTGDTYGPLYGVDDGGNGKAVITLNNAGTIVNGFALDVSKPIYLSYGVSLVDNMAEWITFALTDTLGGAYLSGGSDALTNYRGTLFAFMHHSATQQGNTAPTLSVNPSSNASITPGINNMNDVNYVVAPNGTNTASAFEDYMNTMVIYIGEESGESYITINGIRAIELNCVRSDFADGKAYLTLGSFRTTVLCLKLYQEFGLQAGTVSEGFEGNVSFREETVSFGDMAELIIDSQLNGTKYRVASVTVNGTEYADPELTENQDGTYSFFFAMPFADAEVSVTFTEFYYLVQFDLGYTTVIYDTQRISEGGKAEMPEDPERNGYVFGGWYLDEDFTQEYDFSAAVAQDLHLYAKFTVRTYKATLVSEGETIGTLEASGANARFAEPEDPTREGYVFDGWYLDENFETPYSFNTVVTDDITLYAKWAAQGGETGGCSSSAGGMSVLISAVILLVSGAAVVVLKKKN